MHERLKTFITKLASVLEVTTDQRKLMVFVREGKPENMTKTFTTKIRTDTTPNPI